MHGCEEQGCQNRTGRSDRSYREPDLNPVRLVRKTVPRGNWKKTREPELNRNKTGRSSG
jgi:hypothetical protein